MKETTVVGFAGFCKSDLMLYISRILYISGEKVAIVDRSYEQNLGFSVPDDFNYDNMFEYRGVDIYLGCQKSSIENLPVNDYSAVLVDFGVNPETYEDIKYLKVLYVVSDLNRHHIIPLSAWLRGLTEKNNTVRILRDTVYGKIRPEYIDSILGIRQATNLVATYEFPLDETEYATRLLTQYDDIFKFRKIPTDLKKMLTDCITEIFGINPKTALNALKKAQAGG